MSLIETEPSVRGKRIPLLRACLSNPEKDASANKFPLLDSLDRRGDCAIKKKAAFLAGAGGVVDQAPKQ